MKKRVFLILLISMTFLAYSKEYTDFEMCDYLCQEIVHFYSHNKSFPKTLIDFEYDNMDLKKRLEMYKDVNINYNGKCYFVISFTKNNHEYKLIDNLNQAHVFTFLIDGEVCREYVREIEGMQEEYFFPPMTDMTNFIKEGFPSNDFVISEYND